MKAATRDWLKKAESDWLAALALARRRKTPLHDQVCFHCQQAAEKYLKALLQEFGLPVPRVHDLEALLGNLLPSAPPLRVLRRGLVFLTSFAVEIRYPGENATTRQA